MEKDEFLSSFCITTLYMIFKGGKGRKPNLPDTRFIHSKSWFPRTAEYLAGLQGLKDPLLEGSTIYQIGGQTGHRSKEHVFVFKSIIAKDRAEGKLKILQTLTCYKRAANQKVCRIWYKLNSENSTRVKTGAGLSDYSDVGAVMG